MLTALTTAVLVVVVAPAAVADPSNGQTEQPREAHSVPTGPPSAELTAPGAKSQTGDVTTQAAPTAPLISGCTGQSLVYRTTTNGGRANGEGLISCLGSWPKLYDSTNLYRNRWYGVQALDSDTSTRYNSTWVNSVSIYTCAGQGTYTYYSEAYHEVTSSSGTKYRASTVEGDRFAC
jgi:hypothetical protein